MSQPLGSACESEYTHLRSLADEPISQMGKVGLRAKKELPRGLAAGRGQI